MNKQNILTLPEILAKLNPDETRINFHSHQAATILRGHAEKLEKDEIVFLDGAVFTQKELEPGVFVLQVVYKKVLNVS